MARKQPCETEGLELRGVTVLVREICVEKSRNLIDDREVDGWMLRSTDRQTDRQTDCSGKMKNPDSDSTGPAIRTAGILNQLVKGSGC